MTFFFNHFVDVSDAMEFQERRSWEVKETLFLDNYGEAVLYTDVVLNLFFFALFRTRRIHDRIRCLAKR